MPETNSKNIYLKMKNSTNLKKSGKMTLLSAEALTIYGISSFNILINPTSLNSTLFKKISSHFYSKSSNSTHSQPTPSPTPNSLNALIFAP
jgi:hypothetical protein